ncbi:hypothetical protein PIROE2DRAFT_8419 [Piromyces sp. E2]|nr:hypothetical protein PIROE2DRAFT_8419 [Piromyces sp. E2]|eukprot:OUM64731.1 hypothetical protein PIROE2DRAFT_8419 [Piromyces sp. E2]
MFQNVKVLFFYKFIPKLQENGFCVLTPDLPQHDLTDGPETSAYSFANSVNLLNPISHNNIEIIQLLTDYVKQYQIILDMNEKGIFENYPLMEAISHNNIEIIQLLMEYAKLH